MDRIWTSGHGLKSAERRAIVLVSAKGVTRVLVVVICLLVGLHLASAAVAMSWSVPKPIQHFFSLDSEGAAGAWFSSLELLLCALLLTLIASRKSEQDFYWWGLSIAFYFLALDEGAQIHEMATPLVQMVLGRADGVARRGWIIVFGPLVLVFAGLYVRFLMRLPRAIAFQMVLGGAIFITGALVVEVATAFYKEGLACDFTIANCGGYSVRVLVAIEEAMEMVGIAIFVNCLLRIVPNIVPALELRFCLNYSENGDPLPRNPSEPI